MLCHYFKRHHLVQATQEDDPLVYAAPYSDIPCVRLLLDEGLDVNLEGPAYKGSSTRKI